jgi:hypothetical protein
VSAAVRRTDLRRGAGRLSVMRRSFLRGGVFYSPVIARALIEGRTVT